MRRVTDIPRPPALPVDAHKGTAGLVLVVAGSRGMAGAAALVGNAALRGGAGLVKIATPDAALDTVAALAPCCTTVPLPDDGACLVPEAAAAVRRLAEVWTRTGAEGQSALAMGPGLGRTPGVAEVVREVVGGAAVPLVLDADALNVLGTGARTALKAARAAVVITPHPGEAARLLGIAAREVQADREAAAARLAALGAVAVLKGAGTIVCDGERIYVNRTGNPGMATAGAGDVLTGMLAALVAGGMPMFEAAVLAVWAHGRAGDLAAERLGILGMTALDLLGCLPEALRV
jgi:NAD(P)H-hydrate epimerase